MKNSNKRMTLLEFLQIKNSIDLKRQEDLIRIHVEWFTHLLMIVALYMTQVNLIITAIYGVVVVIYYIIIKLIKDRDHKRKRKILDEALRKGKSAEEAIKTIFSEIEGRKTINPEVFSRDFS